MLFIWCVGKGGRISKGFGGVRPTKGEKGGGLGSGHEH